MAKVALAELSSHLDRFDLPIGFRHRPAVASPFATGLAPIDRLLHGGVPRAALSEICGAASSSRTSLLTAVLSRALNSGECCVWIDAAGSFDPESAALAGLPLNRLLWIDCAGNAEHALKATDLLLQGGGFGLVVFDLGDIPEREVRRISMTSWFRLRNAAEQAGSALIALTSTPQTRSCSALSIAMNRRKSLWRGKLLRGIQALLETGKHSRPVSAVIEAVL